MKIFPVLSGAFLLAVAAPAVAQDAAPTVADGVSTFTGPRAEIFGGWDRVGARYRVTDDAGDRSTVRTHRNGLTVGGLGGYDMPVGNRLVAGVFGSYALSTARSCGDLGSYSGCLKSGRQIEGGARIGAKVLDNRALVYLKGAYVNGRLESNFASGGDVIKASDNQDGWRAGAGAEYALNKHAYLKVEYDYTRFKSYNADLGAEDANLRFDRNQVLGGFGVRF